MNTTTHRRSRRGLPGAAVATTLAVLLTAASAGALAERRSQEAFRMMAIEDSAQGALVKAGRYEEAIKRISARPVRGDAFAANNNLCIAYAKTMALYEAVIACEAAVDSRELRKRAAFQHSSVARQKLRDRAIALSNRGVLRFAIGDLEGAREDFEASIALDSGLEEPGENLLRLQAASVARR